MIVLGLIGRPDVPACHDAAACLVIDGKVVGALEQERVSRRRHAEGEGPEGAVLALLKACNVHPGEIQAIGFAWAGVPKNSIAPRTDIPCGVHVSDQLTETILPTLAGELGTRDIVYFDHHLCHAAGAYFLNPYDRADVLVADGWGGEGSTSLFHVEQDHFRLLERYDTRWLLGMFYGAAAAYAPFAADVQLTVEEAGLALAARLRHLSGEDTLLLSGGVGLNAHMNRRIAQESGYTRVASTVAPHDSGTVFGVAMLAESLLGKSPSPLPVDEGQPIFLAHR
jgi:predicted NodU family carbamoyl transferase